ncbi:MAG: hypothetical protein N3D11_02715 [Candidatus Sumerlaeia bacterium]|nr:hypothetical protein [Candidatus Sumerlaeia bacterium]
MQRSFGGTADLPDVSLLSAAPRQAVLLLYTPNLERLAAAWMLAEPLRQTDDWLARWIASPLDALDRRLLSSWRDRTGLALSDLARALPGEVVIGWMPAGGEKSSPPHMENWVLMARRDSNRDDVLRELWRHLATRAGAAGRVERRAVGPAAVEELIWAESTAAPPATPRRPRSPGDRPASPAPDTSLFQEIQKVERRAFSLGLSERYVFFAPTRAETLSPWVRAAVEGTGAAGRTERLDLLLRDCGRSGEPLLIIKATPPAWVASSESEKERRFGANPARVLLSQTRSLHAVLTRQGNAVQLDAEATVLPPPGWAARLLATLKTGAAVSADNACRSELVFRADLPELWKALRSVLMEGWPTVAAALDLFFAPLGGERGEGIGQLASTLGDKALLYGFHLADSAGAGGGWALALAVRQTAAFADIEPRLADFMATFGHPPVRYTVSESGKLVPRAESPATTASAYLPRIHTAMWDGHYFVAGSKGALEQAMRAVAAQSKAVPVGAASIALRHEVDEAGEGFGPFGGRVRRTIQASDGTLLELISPPKAFGSLPATVAAEPPRPSPDEKTKSTAPPLACLSASLTVQSANIIRIQIRLDSHAEPARVESKVPRATSLKQPRMEE